MDSLQIESYGISISTLEEVFLKVGHLDDKNAGSLIDDQPGLEKEKPLFNMKDNQNELDTSFWSNFTAILYRKTQNYKRNKRGFFSDTVVPALLLLLGVAIS